MFQHFEGVRQYLFIQHGPREFEVQLVLADTSSAGAMTAQVVSVFRDVLGEDAQVKVTMCGEIQPPAHGKFRYVVSHAKPAWWTDPAGVSREGGEVDSRLA
jgi:hypothetical protein